MNVDVVPDVNEPMDASAEASRGFRDTTTIPTAEKRKPLSVRQSKAKRQKPKPPTQEKREFQEDPSTTTKPPKARRVRGKQPQPQALGATINIPKDNKTPNVDEAEDSTGRNRGVIFIKSTSQETNNEQSNIAKQGRNTSDKREV